MEMRAVGRIEPFSADDVLDLPDPENGTGWELVDGQLVPVMPASPLHGELIVEVAYRLRRHVEEWKLPGRVWTDVAFVLSLRRDHDRTRGPDVVYIREERLAGYDPERIFRGVPDLAIEIDLSSAKKPHGQLRIADYLEAGVPLVWVIDPHSETALVLRPDGSARFLRGEDVLDGEDVVPGFRLPLNELFDATAPRSGR